jgi:hypothetical protein
MTLEKFQINRRTYSIEKVEDKFMVRHSGCSIGSWATIEEARKMLHTYAQNQQRAEIGSGERMMANAQTALGLLGIDPFNLGRFRV